MYANRRNVNRWTILLIHKKNTSDYDRRGLKYYTWSAFECSGSWIGEFINRRTQWIDLNYTSCLYFQNVFQIIRYSFTFNQSACGYECVFYGFNVW